MHAAEIVAKAERTDVPSYCINTGFGKLASTRIAPDQTALLQRNLILSHCCGVGPATPEPIVRLMMALKVISLGRGASGVRREIIEQLQGMLARGVTPLVPQQGSVGASGDLAPLAHMTAVMIGEGQAIHGGRIVPGHEALATAGLAPLTLGPKEGLALINGTQFSTAYAISGLLRAHRLACAALVTRLVAGLLYDVSPTDPFAFVGAAVTLLAVGLAASLGPVRRAVRTSPMTALRTE